MHGHLIGDSKKAQTARPRSPWRTHNSSRGCRISKGPRKLTEHQIQIEIVAWLRQQRLICQWRHASNTHSSPAYGRKLTLLGAKAGWPDLDFLFPDGHIAFIELKTEKGRLSPDQREMRDWCLERDIRWCMIRTSSIPDAIAQVREILLKWQAFL